MPTRRDLPKLIDYNGAGPWSRHAILDRYRRYVGELRMPLPRRRDLSPEDHTTDGVRRIYPVMDKVIEGIRAGDPACIRLGVEYLEQDEHFPFGLSQRVHTARALRRLPPSLLPDDLKERLRRRIFGLLADGRVGQRLRGFQDFRGRGFKGYKEYARLLRAIGYTAADIPHIEDPTPLEAALLRYFRDALPPVR